jgi:hypothetical protein
MPLKKTMGPWYMASPLVKGIRRVIDGPSHVWMPTIGRQKRQVTDTASEA